MSDVCERHDMKLLTYGTLVRLRDFLLQFQDMLTHYAVWRILG
jgi:hypothetical protein